MSLQAISIPPRSGNPAKGVLVTLHGWGANAQDVAALSSMLNLPDYQFVFPDAPFRHPYSEVGKAWYNFPANFNFFSQDGFGQYPELVNSRSLLTEWLLALPDITGVPLSRTILSGFSQGGAMTLDVGLNLPLAALMVLSGYIHAPIAPQSAQFPPVLMVHGTQDQVVPIQAAHRAKETLLTLGASVEYHELRMGHEIQPVVLDFMQRFVGERALPLGESR